MYLNRIFVVFLVLSLGFFGACSSKKKSSGMSAVGGASLEVNGDSDSGKAGPLRTIYFDFNTATLREDSREALEENAKFLTSNANVKVQIEGHCDERGGVQYNIALGEKRASVTKQYLMSRGVSSSQLSTISIGKERPIAFGHDESAWSRNRRSNFVILEK